MDGSIALTGIMFTHLQRPAEEISLPIPFSGDLFSGDRDATTGKITFHNGVLPNVGKAPTYDLKARSYLLGFHPNGTNTTAQVQWTTNGGTDILVTNVWDAGTYVKQNAKGMIFNHILSRIEVACALAEGSTQDAVKARWGQIKEIRLLEMPATITLTNNTNHTASSTTLRTLKMLNSSYADFSPIDCPATATTVAVAMVPPTHKSSYSLMVVTEKQDNVVIPIKLTKGRTLTGGFQYTTTLEFGGEAASPVSTRSGATYGRREATITVKSEVTEWGTTASAADYVRTNKTPDNE